MRSHHNRFDKALDIVRAVKSHRVGKYYAKLTIRAPQTNWLRTSDYDRRITMALDHDRAKQAVRELARRFIEVFLWTYLGTQGKKTPETPPEKRSDRFVGWVLATLAGWQEPETRAREPRSYLTTGLHTQLLAPIHHGEYDPCLSNEAKRMENVHEQLFRYAHLLNRPIVVKTPKGGGPPVSSTHHLLEHLVRWCVDAPAWRNARIERLRAPPTANTRPTDDQHYAELARRLNELFTAEQARQKLARCEGAEHGYRKFSDSHNALKEYGHLFLCIGQETLPVPEELGIGDVLCVLPAPIRREFFDEYQQSLQQSAQCNDVEQNGISTVTFPTWLLIWRLFETLNYDYGQKTVKTGLPFSIGNELSFGQAEALVNLRKQAKHCAE